MVPITKETLPPDIIKAIKASVEDIFVMCRSTYNTRAGVASSLIRQLSLRERLIGIAPTHRFSFSRSSCQKLVEVLDGNTGNIVFRDILEFNIEPVRQELTSIITDAVVTWINGIGIEVGSV